MSDPFFSVGCCGGAGPQGSPCRVSWGAAGKGRGVASAVGFVLGRRGQGRAGLCALWGYRAAAVPSGWVCNPLLPVPIACGAERGSGARTWRVVLSDKRLPTATPP